MEILWNVNHKSNLKPFLKTALTLNHLRIMAIPWWRGRSNYLISSRGPRHSYILMQQSTGFSKVAEMWKSWMVTCIATVNTWLILQVFIIFALHLHYVSHDTHSFTVNSERAFSTLFIALRTRCWTAKWRGGETISSFFPLPGDGAVNGLDCIWWTGAGSGPASLTGLSRRAASLFLGRICPFHGPPDVHHHLPGLGLAASLPCDTTAVSATRRFV